MVVIHIHPGSKRIHVMVVGSFLAPYMWIRSKTATKVILKTIFLSWP